jgi:prephenate dehydrogenase
MPEILFNKVCIIGVGLIGGSLARAMRKAGICKTITGTGRSVAHLERAVELGVIDSYSMGLAEAASDAGLVVIATPVGAMSTILPALAGIVSSDTVITDVGSTKRHLTEIARGALGSGMANFVPGHPIAGTECNGVEASVADLFDQHVVILTPTDETDSTMTAIIRTMWERVGARVVEMTPAHHDAVLAATSHLPHVLAFALVDSLARMDDKQEIFEFVAGGFRDFTRIASSDPVMWRDICLENSASILDVLGTFNNDLARLAEAIRNHDADSIMEIFQRAKTARDSLVNGGDGS